MQRIIFAVFAAFLMCVSFASGARAQAVTRLCVESIGVNGSNNCVEVDATHPLPVTGNGAFGLAPYSFTHIAGGQYALAITSATSLTVPAGALFATVQANTATISYTTSGTTPTASVGDQLTAGTSVFLSGADILSHFQSISATGTITVEYFK